MVTTSEEVFRILESIPDPEIPAVNIVELGIVRAVKVEPGKVTVTITPTYSGCPAMHMIEEDIRARLTSAGVADLKIETVLNPAWTTDWLSDETKEKLRQYGIAPPGSSGKSDDVLVGMPRAALPCPFCGSKDTELRSEFGATACKAFYFCNGCRQPFEHFKSF